MKTWLFSDNKLRAEPILIIAAFVLDYFFGKNAFTQWLGWYFFLSVLVCVPAHIYSYMLRFSLGKTAFATKHPSANEWIVSHKSFVFSIYYSLFLHFWWKWL